MIHRLSIFLLLSVVAPLIGFAQQPQPQIVKFSALAWSRTIKDLHFQGSDGELVKLWIPNGSPSKELEYRGILPIQFFRLKGTDEAGNPIKEVAAEYMPGAKTDDLLLIFVNDRGSKVGRYRLLPFSFSAENAPENNYRFINLSSFPVYVKFGDERFKIDQKSERSFDTDVPVSGGKSVAMAIQVSEQPDDVKLAYSSSWSVRSGRSALVFVTTEPGVNEQIEVKKLYY